METKKARDFIKDGILGYGIEVGRFLFEEEHRIVYAVSDYPHIAGSDVYMYYQVDKQSYDRLVSLSCPDQVPSPPVPEETVNTCHQGFLCGESAYARRNKFTLDSVDLSLTESF